MSLESDLLCRKISAEEYFCMALTSDTCPSKAYSNIRTFLEKIRTTHTTVYKKLQEICDDYFRVNPSLIPETEEQQIEIAMALSMQDMNLNPVNDEPSLDSDLSKDSIFTQFTYQPPMYVTPSLPSQPALYETFSYAEKCRAQSSNISTQSAISSVSQSVESHEALSDTLSSSPDDFSKSTNDNSGLTHNPSILNESSKKKRKKRNKNRNQESNNAPVLLWFRKDLRLHDNPALVAAADNFNGSPVIPLYLWNDKEEGALAAGGATKVWLHKSLTKLNQSLIDNYSSKMIFRKTSSYAQELVSLVRETGAKHIVFTALYEPVLAKRDNDIVKTLHNMGVQCHIFHSYLLHRPDQVKTNGVGFRGLGSVLHFQSCCKENPCDPIGQPVPKPGLLPLPDQWPVNHTLSKLELNKMPRRRNGSIIDWAKEMRETWEAGEEAGFKNLMVFLNEHLDHYDKESSRADQEWTAIISPYVHFGELSPRTILHESFGGHSQKFRRKFAWRDLSYWLLYLFPDMDTTSIRPPYGKQRWNNSKADLKAWQKGNTGYPLVDAAMRQLWRIGWLNNYMRHVVASFLISYLHITWVEGYKWFQDTLLDADVAINAMMWQNGGMSGLDHWNFVMHPVDAAMTCDPYGDYVRKWCPELAALPNEFIHQPWKCHPLILKRCNVHLGQNYPNRILIDLNKAREQSLADVTLLRRKYARGYISPHTGNDMIAVPARLLIANGKKKNMTEDDEFDDEIFMNEQRKIMIPLITRKEFKFRTAQPNTDENPFNPVLKGYISRSRDEAIAKRNKIDFASSVMCENITRVENYQKRMGTYEPDHPPRGRGRRRNVPTTQRRSHGHDPFTSV